MHDGGSILVRRHSVCIADNIRDRRRDKCRFRLKRLVLLARDGRDEAIPAFGNGFDIKRLAGGVAQGFAQFHDRCIQAVVEIDKRAGGPERPLQVFAGNQFPGMFQQEDQDAEGLITNLGGRAVPAQFVVAHVYLEDAETPGLRRLRLVFHERSPRQSPLAGSLARAHLKSEAILRTIHPSKYLHINNLSGDKRFDLGITFNELRDLWR